MEKIICATIPILFCLILNKVSIKIRDKKIKIKI